MQDTLEAKICATQLMLETQVAQDTQNATNILHMNFEGHMKRTDLCPALPLSHSHSALTENWSAMKCDYLACSLNLPMKLRHHAHRAVPKLSASAVWV